MTDPLLNVRRYDTAGIEASSVERTPQGGLRIPARLTRTGVLEYRLTDGTMRREYRPADEVFRDYSMRTLEDAPVTHLHPLEGRITVDNHSLLSKGHVRDIRADGDFVVATVVAQDSVVVGLVEQRSLVELSCGYDADLDATPGVTPDGDPYDVVQRNIRYNHVALLPEGHGRAGPDVRLRLDAAGHQLPPNLTEETMAVTKTNPTTTETRNDAAGDPAGEVPALTPETIAQLNQLMALIPLLPMLTKLAEGGAAAAAASETSVEDAAGEAQKPAEGGQAPAGGQPPAQGGQPQPAANQDPEKLIQDSIEIREQARPILGADYSFSGKRNRQIMLDAVTRVDSKLAPAAGASDEVLRASFNAASLLHAERATHQDALAAIHGASVEHTDARDQQTAVGSLTSKIVGASSKR